MDFKILEYVLKQSIFENQCLISLIRWRRENMKKVNEYSIAVEARNYAINQKKKRRIYTDQEILIIKSDLIFAKNQIIGDGRYLLENVEGLSPQYKYEKLAEIDKLEKSLCKYEDAKGFEYVIMSDFNLINRVKKSKNKNALSKESVNDIKKQIEILIETISLLNKAIIIFVEADIQRKNS